MERNNILALVSENNIFGCAIFDPINNFYIVLHDFLDSYAYENIKHVIYMLEIKTILLPLDFDQQVYFKLAQTGTKMLLVERLAHNNFIYKFLCGEKYKHARKSLKTLNMFLKKNGTISKLKQVQYKKDKNTKEGKSELFTHIGMLEGYPVNLYNADNFLYTNIECFDALNIFTKHREIKHVKKLKHKDSSLYSRLNHTATFKGAKLLKDWLKYPLKSINEIEKRREDIEYVVNNNLTYVFQQNMKKIILNPTENILNDIRKFSSAFLNLVDKFYFFDKHLVNDIDRKVLKHLVLVIEDNVNLQTSDRKYKHGVCSKLDSLHALYKNLPDYLNEVCIKVSNEYNVTTCIVYYPQLGYLIETNKVIETLELVFAANEKYYYKDDFIRNVDNEMGDIKTQISDFEVEITSKIYAEFNENKIELEKLYQYFSYIDCITSLALAAQKYSMQKPVITKDYKDFKLKSFVNITLDLDYKQVKPVNVKLNNTTILTGHNGSGKSYFLRNIGIAILLNQIGSYVPATYSRLPVYDKLFVSMHSKESVYESRSAFLSEILQIKNIQTYANAKSIVLVDEFGKGTNVVDGASIFAAIVNNFSDFFCVYSTHFQNIFNKNLFTSVDCLTFTGNNFTPEEGICESSNVETLLKKHFYDKEFIQNFLQHKSNVISNNYLQSKRDDKWAIKTINDFLHS